MKNVFRRFYRVQTQRILQRREMPSADGTKPQTGKVRGIRANQAEVQQRLLLHDMAVSPLAHRERLFNSETKKFRGEINNGMGNEK